MTKRKNYGARAVFAAQIDTLARTVLRDIIGGMDMAIANTSRPVINANLKVALDEQTEKWGMTVVDTAQPREALAKIERGEKYDVIVLDMFMPEMDGSMLAREIRKHYPDIPIVLFSSFGQHETEFESGLFNAYLAKPLKRS